jgi:hypothetical protein
MTKYFLITVLILLALRGCRSDSPQYPTTDPCLALHTIGLSQCSPPDYEAPTKIVLTAGYGKLMQEEITYRLKQIHLLLEQEPLTQGNLSKAIKAVSSQNSGIPEDYRDWELTMLFTELEPVTPVDDRVHINRIRDALFELEQLVPEASTSRNDADPRQARKARQLLKRIDKEWKIILQHAQ